MRLPTPSLRSLTTQAVGAGPSRVLRPSAVRLASASSSPYPTSITPQITTLPNRLRVVTEAIPTHVYALGVYIDAGSRYESDRNSGVTHLLDRMAFKSTAKHNEEEMSGLIHACGGQVTSIGAREHIGYQASLFPAQLSTAMSLLSSTILSPQFRPDEVDAAKAGMEYEIREFWSKADHILPDIAVNTAYTNNTLGMPLLCPEEQLARLGEDELRGYMRDWFKPERMVVAGHGIPHEELVELAFEHFGSLPVGEGVGLPSAQLGLGGSSARSSTRFGAKTYATVSNALVGRDGKIVESDFERLKNAPAVYTGGEQYIEKPDEEFTNLVVLFEGLGALDPDIYALGVLNYLLLGGSAFSAGGPGKGMYSRLMTNVLNRYYAVERAEAFHQCFADSGLFGITLSVRPHFASKAAQIIASQLHTLTGPMMGGVTEEQLGRARNMMRGSMVMMSESRLVAVEDLGRQIMLEGRKEPTEEMCAKIDAVTREDIYRVATRILRPSASTKPVNGGRGSGEPTIVAMGKDVHLLGDVKQVLRQWDLGKRP
ncbi:Metalloenzyme, LuxS/M16 peptidase-like protein [Naematelia encephala]|uniref:Alpha-MPP n=1 Tax=Naematelia encephala TaxID=71784 RepID=A0A1Y2BKU4_9TREE|nr:Metalloenzyme, LuxS/M16 peptidase-like protein [Naematelia encephala]